MVAVLIKTFIVQPFYIPSGSMLPTLEIDDRVMVSKLHYRFGEPDAGDIVVFENPYAPDEDVGFPRAALDAVLEALGIRTSANEDLIKRVIAVEGDRFEIDGGRVLVNGEAIDEPYLADGAVMADQDPRRSRVRDGGQPRIEQRQPGLRSGPRRRHHREGAVPDLAPRSDRVALSSVVATR